MKYKIEEEVNKNVLEYEPFCVLRKKCNPQKTCHGSSLAIAWER